MFSRVSTTRWSTIGISVFIYFVPGQLIVFVHLYFAPGELAVFVYLYIFERRNPPSVHFPFPPALVLNLTTADQDCENISRFVKQTNSRRKGKMGKDLQST